MAFDAYLKFVTPDVLGEAELGAVYEPKVDGTRTGWIEMTEYGFGASMAVSAARSSGTGAATTGKGKLEPFTFKKAVDATSMTLAFHAAAGTVFQKIVVAIFVSLDSGDGSTQKPHTFLTIEMKGAVIASCAFSGGGGDELPTEDVSINYGFIDYTYNPFTVDLETGKVTTGANPSTFKWNTITNKGEKSA
jgi:type VI protein secretion system component Hcp